MNDNNPNKELQELVFQIENGKHQLEGLSKQANMIEQGVMESEITLSALKALEESDKENKILVNLGSNTYIYAKIENKEDILVGIGAGVTIEKSREDTIKMIDNRHSDLLKKQREIQSTAQTLGHELNKLNTLAEKMSSQLPKQ